MIRGAAGSKKKRGWECVESKRHFNNHSKLIPVLLIPTLMAQENRSNSKKIHTFLLFLCIDVDITLKLNIYPSRG